jgi:hypothetical protein
MMKGGDVLKAAGGEGRPVEAFGRRVPVQLPVQPVVVAGGTVTGTGGR